MSNFGQHFNIISSRMLTLENLWRSAKFTPNDAQRDAILHAEGPLYITAGPGSGKTRVLLWRTLNLVVFHEVPPEEIYLSTFTEKAALQLREGLQAILGRATNLNGKPYDLSAMYIGTVHSLCRRMLADRRKFDIDLHTNRPPTLMDDLGQYFHFSRRSVWEGMRQSVGIADDFNNRINTIFGPPSASQHVAVNNCKSLFNRFSEEMIDVDRALARCAHPDPELLQFISAQGISLEDLRLLLELYRAYQDSLVDENGTRRTDFSLLQWEAYRMLCNQPSPLQAFQYVIVDEYQDTNTIQERLFFKLAEVNHNICVVGDDDQALYRFRGATVENFVEFPSRCKQYLNQEPTRITLSTNYRSRPEIVDFYTDFISNHDWERGNEQSGYFRVMDKHIRANRETTGPTVIASSAAPPDVVNSEIACFVKRLVDEGKVEDPNQIAFLFPSLKYNGKMTDRVAQIKHALEAEGLQVYAPRAGRFLDVDECVDVFGVFLHILGRPHQSQVRGGDMASFKDWLDRVEARGQELIDADPRLKKFVDDHRAELERIKNDYEFLTQAVIRRRWNESTDYDPRKMKRALASTSGLSEATCKQLISGYLERTVQTRIDEGRPFNLRYILRRVTSVDWNTLDLFYKLCGFSHFKRMFDVAESGEDEGPVSNLGLITQYLARFAEERVTMITGNLLVDQMFQHLFFSSYLFALYRLGETELEDADDPFPKGRIPFLTIHQSKGLEFPVVVLGNPRKNRRPPSKQEVMSRALMDRDSGEPLDRMTDFDIMRMFYVALSRAKNLLVLAHFKGHGQSVYGPFKEMLKQDHLTRIPNFDMDTLLPAEEKDNTLPKTYSFTADYLVYNKCPRQYMIFRKYGFVPSRTQTMFFGSLVHRTLDDLHHELIKRRGLSDG